MAGVLTHNHLGHSAVAAPMSVIGAGGFALLSLCNVSIPRLFVVFRVRMGRVCLAYYPFTPPRAPATAKEDSFQKARARIKAH